MKVKYDGKQAFWSPKTLKDTNEAYRLLEVIGIKICLKNHDMKGRVFNGETK